MGKDAIGRRGERVPTLFIAARPSFLSGLARALDAGATFNQYSTSRTAREADARAMYMDLKILADDFRQAADRELGRARA